MKTVAHPRADRGQRADGKPGWYRRSITFLQEVVAELKRTTWPKWTEVRGTTTVVIIAVFIFAAFLWGVDLVLGFIYQKIIQLLK